LAAKLIIDEDDYGVQFFVLQIRDILTHLPLSGLEIGDMGSKLGFNVKDTGFIRFTNFRIPRENLVSYFGKLIIILADAILQA
jgi:acyl-CoA oxidase